MTDHLKSCTQCKVQKSLSDFPKHRSAHDGRMKICRDCRYPDIPEFCPRCNERPPDIKHGYHLCSRCRHGAPVLCPSCGGPKQPAAKRCQKCRHQYAKGPQHSCWKGGRIKDRDGYIRIWMPEDPRANCGRYMKEHVVVMEKMIKRQLMHGEAVHHKNGNRSDNSPENLELWSTHQPSGQRIEDKVQWAREILDLYGTLVDRGINGSGTHRDS